ncbi:MAG: RidA family protein [Fidelibacterota bacterium]|nr:MAG: RidA family protein [Candidatus Neomarinimicrobiota bacterium]
MIRPTVLLISLVLILGCGQTDLDHEIIVTEGAPAAIGPYSQAVRVGRMLYLAGQIGLDPATGQMVTGGIEAETRQVMANIQAVLTAAGYGFKHVVQVQAYLADLDDYGTFNALYGEYFGDRPPARAVVQVDRLPRNARVEVMATAVR